MNLVFVLLFIAAAIAIFVWGGSRSFYRRNAFGREQFRSYGEMMKTRLLEKAAGGFGIFLFVVGASAAFP